MPTDLPAPPVYFVSVIAVKRALGAVAWHSEREILLARNLLQQGLSYQQVAQVLLRSRAA